MTSCKKCQADPTKHDLEKLVGDLSTLLLRTVRTINKGTAIDRRHLSKLATEFLVKNKLTTPLRVIGIQEDPGTNNQVFPTSSNYMLCEDDCAPD